MANFLFSQSLLIPGNIKFDFKEYKVNREEVEVDMVRFIIVLVITLSIVFPIHSAEVYIVPKPQEINVLSGKFTLEEGQVGLHLLNPKSERLQLAIIDLQNEIFDKTGFKVSLNQEEELNIRVGIPEKNEDLLNKITSIGIWPEERINSEGYVLSIGTSQILIAATHETGIFYGIQTLKQIIRGNSSANEISCMQITDWPELKYRAMQDDISRGPVPTLDFMKKQVRRCAEMKLNMLSYYIEHVVKTEKHGDFAPAKGSISIAEWKELNAYAGKYFIQLLGNFQSLGHFEKIMALPQYRHMGETDRMISPVLPESIEFLKDVYSEMVPVFSAPFFNANCDEVWDLGRGPSKDQVEEFGIAKVYADHVMRLNEQVTKLDKRLMIWGDIVHEHPELFDMLDKNIVQGVWNYGALDSFDHLIQPFHDSGFDFMFSCGVLNSNRILPDYKMTFKNIKNFNRDAKKYNTLGMLNTVWDDGGTALFSLDWYGVAYGAEHSWHGNDDSIDEFNQRFDRGIYGIKKGQLGAAFQNMARLSTLQTTYEMNVHVSWEKILPDRMRSLNLNLSDTQTIADILQDSERMLTNFESRRYEGDLEYLKFVINQYQFIANGRAMALDAANSYKLACIFQMENADSTNKYLNRALANIHALVNNVEHTRNLYVKLWNQENQSYWLDHITEQYDQRIGQYKLVANYLIRAQKFYQQNLSLPAPNEISLEVSESKGSYFQFWLLCGPFPNVNWQGRDTDYLKSIGGESGARPIPGTIVNADDGRELRFSKYTSPVPNKVELDQIYEKNTKVLAYAYCRIESPDDRKVRATLGSNDGIQIFLNGEKVYQNFKKRSLMPDEDEVYLPLKKGKNHMLLKVDQNNGGWGFSFRLPDEIIRNHKQKYKIIAQ